MNPAQQAAQDWADTAIAECRSDPALAKQEAEGDLCISCMMSCPCLCDKRQTLPKMRSFYEANRRTLWRRELVLNMSWGEKGDGLMDGLYKIATGPYVAEINRLTAKIRKMESGV